MISVEILPSIQGELKLQVKSKSILGRIRQALGYDSASQVELILPPGTLQWRQFVNRFSLDAADLYEGKQVKMDNESDLLDYFREPGFTYYGLMNDILKQEDIYDEN